MNKNKEKHNRSKSLDYNFDADLEKTEKHSVPIYNDIANHSTRYSHNRIGKSQHKNDPQPSKSCRKKKHTAELKMPCVEPNHATSISQSKFNNDMMYAKHSQKCRFALRYESVFNYSNIHKLRAKIY